MRESTGRHTAPVLGGDRARTGAGPFAGVIRGEDPLTDRRAEAMLLPGVTCLVADGWDGVRTNAASAMMLRKSTFCASTAAERHTGPPLPGDGAERSSGVMGRPDRGVV